MNKTNSCLDQEQNPLRYFSLTIATALKSVDRAIMLGQIQWSVQHHSDRREIYEKEYFHDGKWWMKDTDKAWSRYAPWKSERAWRRDKAWLRDNGWIFVEQLNKSKWDQTSYLAVNWDKINEALKPTNVRVDADETSGSTSGKSVRVDTDESSGSSSSYISNYISNYEETSQSSVPVKKRKYSDNDLVLANRWLDEHIKINKPNLYEKYKNSVEDFAVQFSSIRNRKDLKYSDEHMTQIVDYFLESWWVKVLITPSGFKNKNNEEKILNIERIVAAMMTKHTKSESKEAKFQRDLEEVCGKSDADNEVVIEGSLESDWDWGIQ